MPKNIGMPAEVMLVIATGAARKEKCLKIVSQAKIVPAIGAIKPATIALNTTAINTSVLIFPLVNVLM